MEENNTYMAGLYLRLSNDDETDSESVSIGTQRSSAVQNCIKMTVAATIALIELFSQGVTLAVSIHLIWKQQQNRSV